MSAVAQFLCSVEGNATDPMHGLIPELHRNTTIWQTLTPCIVYSLAQLPSTIFGLFTLLIVLGSVCLSSRNRPLNYKHKLTRLKLLLYFTSMLASFTFSLLELFADTLDNEHRVHSLTDIIFNLSTFISYLLCLRHGYITSACIHSSWILRVMASIPLNLHLFDYVFLKENYNVFSIFLYLLAFVELFSSLAISTLLWWPDTRQGQYEQLGQKPLSPSSSCSAVQLAGFFYVFNFLRKTFKKTVTYDDYWSLDKNNQVGFIRQKLHGKSTSTMCSLLWVLVKCSWFNMLMSFIHGFTITFLRFSNGLLILLILEVCGGDYPLWLKLLIGIVPVLVDSTRIVYRQNYFYRGRMAYCNLASAFNSMIFDKMFRLSPQAQTQTAVGIIMNHVTVDLIRVRIFWSYMKDFIIAPINITIAMTFLNQIIGIRGTVYGTLVLFGFMVINVFMSRFSMRFYKNQMNFKDERLKLLNDILNGIRVLKLYGWEIPIQNMVAAIRAKEIREMQKSVFFNSFLDGSFAFGPILATVVSFHGFVVLDGGQMTPKIAFMTLFLFDTVRVSINFLPQLFICTVTAFVSFKRLLKFLNQEERPVERNIYKFNEFYGNDKDVVVSMNNASYSYSDNPNELCLKNIDLKIKKGQLVGVIGSVGSGKSTFLQAIIGELQPLRGDFHLITDRPAYVPQQAWIQNLTLKQNILFDSEYETEYYERVLDACALRTDIQLLKFGDLTEIGEKGVNLSGGQKARVSLARSVYHQADFYAIDDPFSAVDSHVSEHLFNEVVGPNGLLNQSTRVVALNSVKFLPQFDWIICLSDGKVTHSGTFAELIMDPTSPIAAHSNKSSTSRFEKSSTESSLTLSDDKQELEKDRETDKLIEEENLSYGTVSKSIYYDYFRAYGIWNFFIFTPLMFVLFTGMNAMSNIYLAKWSSAASANASLSNFDELETYAWLGLGGSGLSFFVFVLLNIGAYRASRLFHKNMIKSVIRAPMSFFDQTPIGRIMNRFSTDMEAVDQTMPGVIGGSFLMIEEAAYSLTGILISLPWLTPVLIPCITAFVYITRYFNAATAQFRRMVTSATSQVCSAIQDSYNGASSIRCYGSIKRFQDQLGTYLDRVTEANFVEQAVSAWVRSVLCMLSNTAIMVFILVGIWMSSEQMISLGVLGLIINSSFMLNNVFGSICEQYRQAEAEIVCVERIKEYTKLKNEGVWLNEGKGNPLTEAPNGKIEFCDVSLKYREEDAPVLHDLSFSIESGQKVGIIGRTGAGKTSITSVLFRLVEPFQGHIKIGDVDIKRYGTNLRRILTIIPQDPVLFVGTLKANLDPFNEYTSEQIWDALQKANLSEFVQNLTSGLDYEIMDGGSNLSVGQRQLVCLARALLRTSTILVLDEATAAVDHETDRLIQQTIRQNFSNCTILTIAHRLETIMDYDKVIVMEAGRLEEFDSISNLLLDQNSLFYGFANKGKAQP